MEKIKQLISENFNYLDEKINYLKCISEDFAQIP